METTRGRHEYISVDSISVLLREKRFLDSVGTDRFATSYIDMQIPIPVMPFQPPGYSTLPIPQLARGKLASYWNKISLALASLYETVRDEIFPDYINICRCSVYTSPGTPVVSMGPAARFCSPAWRQKQIRGCNDWSCFQGF